jgi:hypothetical protein
MKPTLLSVKEIAQEMGVSTQSIRRAYWKGDIPAFRVCKMLRFDLERVRGFYWRKDCRQIVRLRRRAPGGASRRRAARKRPRLVTRGHYPQGSLQEVYGVDEFTLHPHH